MKAAHLKPVDSVPRDIIPASRPWTTASSTADVGGDAGASLVTGPPTNQQEFLRAWRGCAADGAKRYGLLVQLGAEGLEQVFPVESSMQLLGDILVALNKVCHTSAHLVASSRCHCDMKYNYVCCAGDCCCH